MNITPNERDKAVEAILREGLTRPVSTPTFLLNIYRNLGFRVIFRGALPGIMLSCLIAVAYIVLVGMQSELMNMSRNYYTLLFLFSPALFMGLTLSTEAIERVDGLYELKMTCRYTIRQITAFRLLCFSLVGTIFAVVGSLIFYSVTEAGYLLQLLSLALSSVFLCTLLIIYTMRRLRMGWYIGAGIWLALGTLPIALFGQQWNTLLSHLPPAITLSVAVISFGLFLREIKIITREVRYADC